MMLSSDVPMYAAFIAHGADSVASQKYPNGLVEAAAMVDQGFWEYMQGMIEHANVIDTLVNIVVLNNHSLNFPGVFEYEVVEEFGQWYVEQTINRGPRMVGRRYEAPNDAECQAWLRQRVYDFFAQAWDSDLFTLEELKIALGIKENA